MEAEAGMEFDEGNMCVFDGGAHGGLQPAAEALVHRLFRLKRAEDSGQGVLVVTLPEPTTRLPREKRIPAKPEMTRWEKFALEKGIKKRKKRDRMVFDEESETFVPRFGYKSKNSLKKVEVINDRPDIQPGDNPFTKLKQEKNAKVAKNKKKMVANEKRGKGASQNSSNNKPMVTIEAEKGASGKAKIPQSRLRASVKTAQLSTASVGRFDRRVKNETEPRPAGKRRKFEPVAKTDSAADEKKQMRRIAERVFMPKPEPATKPNPVPTDAKQTKKKKNKKK